MYNHPSKSHRLHTGSDQYGRFPFFGSPDLRRLGPTTEDLMSVRRVSLFRLR